MLRKVLAITLRTVFGVIWLGVPAVTALVLALVTPRRTWWAWALLALGIALGAAFFLIVFLNAPPDYQHSQGESDGEMFWGRWWEPGFTIFLVSIGYVGWALGVGGGLAARALLRPATN